MQEDSQIVSQKKSFIQVNDEHTEPAIEYEIKEWLFNKIKEDLDRMDSRNLVIL